MKILPYKHILCLLSIWIISQNLLAEQVTTIDANDLSIQQIKDNSNLKIIGVLTPETVSVFKSAGISGETSSPNSNVKSVDFSEAIITEPLVLDSIFLNYLELTSVIMPFSGAENITSMNAAFFTSGITDIDLSNCTGITSLQSAFNGCKRLKRVDISGCEKLENLFLAFSNAPSLEEIIMPDKAPQLKVMFHMIIGNNSLRELKLPSIVHPECLSTYSIIDCSLLHKLTLPTNIKQLQDASLFSCPNLTELIFEGDIPLLWNEGAFYSERAQSTTTPAFLTLYVKEEQIEYYLQDYGWRNIKAILPITSTNVDYRKNEGIELIYHNVYLNSIKSATESTITFYPINGNQTYTLSLSPGVTPIPDYIPSGFYILKIVKSNNDKTYKTFIR